VGGRQIVDERYRTDAKALISSQRDRLYAQPKVFLISDEATPICDGNDHRIAVFTPHTPGALRLRPEAPMAGAQGGDTLQPLEEIWL
jgi:hypothetical protein